MNIFFGALSNDYLTARRVILTSEVGKPIHLLSKTHSATGGWNRLLLEAQNQKADVAVLCHQDIFYPEGWVKKFTDGLEKLPENWIIAGYFGIKDGRPAGKIWDRRMMSPMITDHELPIEVDNVDGCAFAVNMKSGFVFEKLKGYDTYDVYMSLRAKEMGGTTWVIDAPPEHFATRPFNWKPDETFLENWEWLKTRFDKKKLCSTCYHD